MKSVVVSLLHSLRFLVRSRASLHLEIIALRHQLAVVNRLRRPRLRVTSADRMLWAWLSRAWLAWRTAVHIVKPETVVAWHRRGFRLFWTWKSRQRTGRPGIPPDVRALIRQLSTANPLWGAPRIHGELQKLGISVSQSTVATYMRRHPRPPSQTWRSFLTNHTSQIVAADLFVVPTVTFRLLFVLVLLGHDRLICRRLSGDVVEEAARPMWLGPESPNLRRAPRGPDLGEVLRRAVTLECDHKLTGSRTPSAAIFLALPSRHQGAAAFLTERKLSKCRARAEMGAVDPAILQGGSMPERSGEGTGR